MEALVVRMAVWSKYSNVLKPWVMSSRAERLCENVTENVTRQTWSRVTLCYFYLGMLLSWIVRSARNMIGFKQIEFFYHTGLPTMRPAKIPSPRDHRESGRPHLWEIWV
jgi:hypothetical protein